MALLITHGHMDAYTYPLSFFRIALKEVFSKIEDDMRYKAIAHRASKLESKEFEAFYRGEEQKKETKKMSEIRV